MEPWAHMGRWAHMGPGAQMGLGHMGLGPHGPGPIWAQGSCGPWDHMGPGPPGPMPVLASRIQSGNGVLYVFMLRFIIFRYLLFSQVLPIYPRGLCRGGLAKGSALLRWIGFAEIGRLFRDGLALLRWAGFAEIG